jgi:hypothetical protein
MCHGMMTHHLGTTFGDENLGSRAFVEHFPFEKENKNNKENEKSRKHKVLNSSISGK